MAAGDTLRHVTTQDQWIFDSTGAVVGLKNPNASGSDLRYDANATSMAGVASQLVAAYEAQARENASLGHFLETRAGLLAADTPTISGSATIPSSDGTDPATQRISLFGSDLTAVTEMSVAQAILGKRWLRGFSPGALNRGEASTYRLSASQATYNVAGNQGTKSDGYGYDGGITYSDLVLDGDVLYTRIESGQKFYLWVNDNLVGATATLGANTTFDATAIAFVPGTGGHGYTKIKFGTVARRTIRIAVFAASSIGDFWTRATATLTPRYVLPIEWVHFGDSFSAYTGATTYRIGLTEYLSTAFGRGLNFINAGQGSTSFANTAQNFPGATPVNGQKGSFSQQFAGNWTNCTPQVVTCLVGHNDANTAAATVASRVTEMLTPVRTQFPKALIIAFTTNASPGIINTGADVTVETAILNAISAMNKGIITVPMQSTANPYGAFLRGTGNAGGTTGVGNTDIYTASDNTHPTDTGHKATGTWMASRMYDALKTSLSA